MPFLAKSALLVLALVGSSWGAVNCSDSSFDWSFSSRGDSPCTVAEILGRRCDDTWTVDALRDNNIYTGVNTGFTSDCVCNTVYYSLLSVCGQCQGANHAPGIVDYRSWNVNCTSLFTSEYPRDIPQGLSVPHWAYNALTNASTVDLAAAQADNGAESTAPAGATSVGSTTTSGTAGPTSSGGGGEAQQSSNPTQSTSPSGSNTSSSDTSSQSSSGSNTNVGAIVGGVIGGLALLAFIVVALLFLRRRRTQNGPIDLTAAPHNSGSISPFRERRESSSVTPYTYSQVPSGVTPLSASSQHSASTGFSPAQASSGIMSKHQMQVQQQRAANAHTSEPSRSSVAQSSSAATPSVAGYEDAHGHLPPPPYRQMSQPSTNLKN